MLTSATVTMILKDPDDVITEHTATVNDAAGGEAYYVTLTTDLDEGGRWKRRWKVVDGGTVGEFSWEEFVVYNTD